MNQAHEPMPTAAGFHPHGSLLTSPGATHCNHASLSRSILANCPPGADSLERVKRLAGGMLGVTTIKALAAQFGVHRGHLYRVVSGERASVALRRRVAATFSCRVDDIWPASHGDGSNVGPGGGGAQ